MNYPKHFYPYNPYNNILAPTIIPRGVISPNVVISYSRPFCDNCYLYSYPHYYPYNYPHEYGTIYGYNNVYPPYYSYIPHY